MDNQGAICISKSYENSRRSKHFVIKYHFIKYLTENNVMYVPSNENVADIFTKALPFS